MDCIRRARTAAVVATVVVGSLFAAPLAVEAAPAAPEHSTVTRSASTSQRNSILRLYKAYFLRNPDRSGMDHWSSQYSSGRMSLGSISEHFARSAEFRSRYGSLSDKDFVKLVYRNVLGRVPDGDGQAYWAQTLRSGMTRGQIMVGFSESVEFQRKTGTLPPATTTSWNVQMLQRINVERSKRGLRALTACRTLDNAAGAHSADQARNGRLSHTGSDGSDPGRRILRAGYDFMAWGENVAAGHTSVDQVVDAWMMSSGHRENILNPNFVHLGLGRVSGGNGVLYWTQDFGAGGRC